MIWFTVWAVTATNSLIVLLNMSSGRQCLNCGMNIEFGIEICPKCDGVLNKQSDGSRLHIDIAHEGEHVSDALLKLEQVIEEAQSGYSLSIRVVVGTGVIREEVLRQLNWLRSTRRIVDFHTDGNNQGAVIISIR